MSIDKTRIISNVCHNNYFKDLVLSNATAVAKQAIPAIPNSIDVSTNERHIIANTMKKILKNDVSVMA